MSSLNNERMGELFDHLKHIQNLAEVIEPIIHLLLRRLVVAMLHISFWLNYEN